MCSFYCLDFVSEMLDGRNHLSQALESLQRLQREALCCQAKLGVTPGSATSGKARGKVTATLLQVGLPWCALE